MTFRLPQFIDIASAMAEDIARVDIHTAAATMAAMSDAADPTGWAFDDAWAADRDAEEAAEFGGGDLRVPWWDADLVEDCNGIDPDAQGRTPLMSDEVWA